MNEIRFGDAVESDTIADLLQPIENWYVTLLLANTDGLTVEGEVAYVNRDGIALKEATHSNLWYWTNVEAVTIH